MAWPPATFRSEIPERVVERVYSRFDYNSDGCKVSRYSTASHGYAQVGWNNGKERKLMLCHRVAWVVEYGDIEEGMTVDHLCKNRRCMNTAHMRLLTNYENARRTKGRDWPLGQCVNGHSNEHLTQSPDGRTHCAICMADWGRNKVARQSERRRDAA